MAILSSLDVKVYYDEHGNPIEVLMPYELFQNVEKLLARVGEQSYFWTDSWQMRIRESETDIVEGRVYKTTVENLEAALGWLDA